MRNIKQYSFFCRPQVPPLPTIKGKKQFYDVFSLEKVRLKSVSINLDQCVIASLCNLFMDTSFFLLHSDQCQGVCGKFPTTQCFPGRASALYHLGIFCCRPSIRLLYEWVFKTDQGQTQIGDRPEIELRISNWFYAQYSIH